MVIAVMLALVAAFWVAFCGWQWGWGPFSSLHGLKTRHLPGNAGAYGIDQAQIIPNSPLQGKHLIFLGSSVTAGSASGQVSFVDFIAKRNQCTVTKEAVSGTTLVDSGADSYIQRMRSLDASMPADMFICQLSTNDASQKKPLGALSNSFRLEDFDTATIIGAVEYIICYAREAWHCPVVFFTNPRYGNEEYGQMVDALMTVQRKWGIGVIDLWDDAGFNDLSAEKRSLYMADAVHPTKAGYLQWWTPAMEAYVYDTIASKE